MGAFLLPLLGAGLGAMTNKQHPWQGALKGGLSGLGAGFLGPSMGGTMGGPGMQQALPMLGNLLRRQQQPPPQVNPQFHLPRVNFGGYNNVS